MGDFILLWLRGLVFTVAFVIAVTVFFGILSFAVLTPYVGVPILVLILLPLMFGIVTEGKL